MRDAAWDSMTSEPFYSPEQAVIAFTRMMADQGYEVYELPRTSRTLAWGCGSVFSALPKDGGESRVFGVAVSAIQKQSGRVPPPMQPRTSYHHYVGQAGRSLGPRPSGTPSYGNSATMWIKLAARPTRTLM